MTQNFSINLKEIRKVYPRKLQDQIVSVVMDLVGRPVENPKGGLALAPLTLSIRNGERLGIIGPNGAGKSTLLQILAGITEPTSGQLDITGKVTAVLTLGIGLNENLSGRQNIYLDGETQGKSRKEIEPYIANVIEFAELGNFIDLPLHTYSTGMKARLAFAMVVQINPEILIIDETLSVGDAAFSAKASKKIRELCSRGAIVIIVSHNMQSVQELCDRCLWLDQGKLIMDGLPEEVTRAYLENVKATSDADHAARFPDLVGVRNWIDGFTLGNLKMTSASQGVAHLMSGAPLTISCTFSKADEDSKGKFYLRCIRLDGILVHEHEVNPPTKSGAVDLVMTYPNFNLAAGLYRLQLEWQSDVGAPRAESTSLLEVIARDMPTGGRPVLLGIGNIVSLDASEGLDVNTGF